MSLFLYRHYFMFLFIEFHVSIYRRLPGRLFLQLGAQGAVHAHGHGRLRQDLQQRRIFVSMELRALRNSPALRLPDGRLP